MKCIVLGCGRHSLARGWCKLHYERWRRFGDPKASVRAISARGAPLAWLHAHKDHVGDKCVPWPFARFPDGRAHMRAGKPTRIMCELIHGAAPSPRHEAAHSCGNGHLACVNPRHLRWATADENAADKEGHGTVVRGQRHHAAKLNEADVIVIRNLAGTVPQSRLANNYGVRTSCISKIVNRQAWGHIP